VSIVTEAETIIRQGGSEFFSIKQRLISVGQIVEALNGFANAPNTPPALGVSLRASAWLVMVEGFRALEEGYMLEGKYEETLDEHRVQLIDLIAHGEAVILAAKRLGMDEDAVKFTFSDLEATLESLHRTFRGEHGPKNSEKTNDLISRLFDGSKS
jgi:hypothetical protein